MSRIVVVHGVRNYQRGLSPHAAQDALAAAWGDRLAIGYKDACLEHLDPPHITAAYYAHPSQQRRSPGRG